MLETTNLERLGFWGLVFFTIIKDGLIPLANRYFPARLKINERQQNREDKEQEFRQQMELRQVEALEGIQKILVITNERLSSIEDTQKAVLARMPKHSKKVIN